MLLVNPVVEQPNWPNNGWVELVQNHQLICNTHSSGEPLQPWFRRISYLLRRIWNRCSQVPLWAIWESVGEKCNIWNCWAPHNVTVVRWHRNILKLALLILPLHYHCRAELAFNSDGIRLINLGWNTDSRRLVGGSHLDDTTCINLEGNLFRSWYLLEVVGWPTVRTESHNPSFLEDLAHFFSQNKLNGSTN